MPSAEFKSLWQSAGRTVFTAMSQPVTWISLPTKQAVPLRAIVDELPYSTEMRPGGGGLQEEFMGSVVLLKQDLLSGGCPKVGDDLVLSPTLTVRIKEVDGSRDQLDPFLTCHYWPKDR